MYRITCDNQTIYDPRSKELQVKDPRGVLGMGVAGSLTFKIPRQHPYCGSLIEKKSILRWYQDDILLWQGKISKIDRDKHNMKSVTAKGDLADLNDSVQIYAEYHDISLRDYLQALLDIHNAQVDESRQFTLGNVTVEDSNDSLYRYSTYESTYQTIKSRLVDRLGGYLVVRYADGIRYLDYLKEYGRVSGQKIAYGRNLTDFAVSSSTDDFATVLLPLGAKLTDVDGNTTEERLTVAAANNGSIFIEDAEAVEQYGRIVKTVFYDDVTLVENLLSKGYSDLEACKDVINTFKLRAVDLSIFNLNTDKIFVGDLVGVESAPHDVSDYIVVSERQYYLAAPEKDVITMNKVRKGFVDTQISASEALRVEFQQTVTERFNTVTQKVETYNIELQKGIDNVSASVTETQTQISTTTENIYDEISGVREQTVTQEQLEEVKSTVLELSSDNVEMRFTQVKNLIDELGGTVEDNQRLLEEYIRFEGARMELGRSDSTITAVLQNDRLSFLENGQEVAYISNLMLFVTDIHVLGLLRHGNADVGYYDEVIGETGTLDLEYVEV